VLSKAGRDKWNFAEMTKMTILVTGNGSVMMAEGEWSVAGAKAKFSEVIERAQTEGPQRVTRNGKATAVIVSAAEWARQMRRPRTVHEFLERSPLRGSPIDLDRDRDEGRDVDLE
jgi:prevent-host-death family protein